MSDVARDPEEAKRTGLVGVDKLPRLLILLIHLVLQVSLSLVQHLQRAPQLQNRLLGGILVLCLASAKPAAQPPA